MRLFYIYPQLLSYAQVLFSLRNTGEQPGSRSLYGINSLHNQSRGCTTTVANGCNTIFTRLELMQ